MAMSLGRRGSAEEIRTWFDKTGQHKIQAQIVGYENGKVTLKKADGKTVVLPIAN